MTDRPSHDVDAGDPYVPGRGDRRWGAQGYDLDLDYRVAGNRLAGRVRIAVRTRRSTAEVALDLADHLTVAKVLIDGRRVRWRHRGGRLRVALPDPVEAGVDLAVEVAYAGRPRPLRGAWGAIGWEELTDGSLTANQPDGASSWFPCNDHPADKAPYRVAVSVEPGYRVVAPGHLLGARTGPSTVRWEHHQPAPTPTYLVGVQIGRYDLVELAAAPVPLRVAVSPALAHPVRADLGRQRAMLECFVATFGPYPYDSYTVVVTDDPLEIPLEAQGGAVFGSGHLDGSGHEERLVAHELAHQWFGNALTAARWSDIWLHEGFACFAEWVWSEAAGGPTVEQLAGQHHERLRGLPQDLLLRDPGPALMFDDRVYKRGALLLHELRALLGPEAFGRFLRAWVDEHRHGTVTTDGFRAEAVAVGGPPVAALLAAWLDDPALPPLSGR